MTEYNEGDLVEAVKGEMVARSRLTTSRFTCNTGETGLHLEGFGSIPFVNSDEVGRDGWVFTVIEKAKPKVELPSEPGDYRDVHGEHWTLHKNGQWFAHGDGSLRTQWHAREMTANGVNFHPLVRLEPRGVTAKAVVERFKEMWHDDTGLTYSQECAQIAAEFGVTND